MHLLGRLPDLEIAFKAFLSYLIVFLKEQGSFLSSYLESAKNY